MVPLMLYLHGRLAADLAATRGEFRADVGEVRRDLRKRVARIEGALTGLWRPAKTPPEATAE